MDWQQRLLRRIEVLGWKQVELARRANINPDRLYKWLNPDNPKRVRSPRGDALERLAKAVGWKVPELLFGIGLEDARTEADAAMRLPLYDWEDLGMLDVKGRAKGLKVITDLPRVDDTVGQDAFYTTVPDDSNAPDIKEGDRVLCDPAKAPTAGKYVIAMVEGHPAPILARYEVKKSKNGKPTVVALAPNNTAFETVRVTKMASLRILGRITHRVERLV